MYYRGANCYFWCSISLTGINTGTLPEPDCRSAPPDSTILSYVARVFVHILKTSWCLNNIFDVAPSLLLCFSIFSSSATIVMGINWKRELTWMRLVMRKTITIHFCLTPLLALSERCPEEPTPVSSKAYVQRKSVTKDMNSAAACLESIHFHGVKSLTFLNPSNQSATNPFSICTCMNTFN